MKPSLVPYLGKPVGLLVLSITLYVLNQSDVLALMLSTLPFPVTPRSLQTFESLFNVLSLASLVTGAVAAISLLMAITYRNAKTFFLTEDGIIIRRSFISRIRRDIPYTKISDVTVEQTFLGRIFGYGDVVPVTISGFGAMAQVRNVAESRLDQLDSVNNPYHISQLILARAQLHSEPSEPRNRKEAS